MDGRHFVPHNAFTSQRRIRPLKVKDRTWKTWLMDLSSTTIREADPTLDRLYFERKLARADGIVLLYDITSQQSFDRVTNEVYMYVWSCRCAEGAKGEKYVSGSQRFGCILLGNKSDLVKNWPPLREVSTQMGEEWAQSQGFRHMEVSSNDYDEVEAAITELVRSISLTRKRDMAESEASKAADAQLRSKEREKPNIRERMSKMWQKVLPGS